MMNKKIAGQSVIEYFVIMAVILAAIISSGIIGREGRIQRVFNNYFDNAVEHMR